MSPQAFAAAMILAAFAGFCAYTLIHVIRTLRK
jgi:hypothetical protein